MGFWGGGNARRGQLFFKLLHNVMQRVDASRRQCVKGHSMLRSTSADRYGGGLQPQKNFAAGFCCDFGVLNITCGQNASSTISVAGKWAQIPRVSQLLIMDDRMSGFHIPLPLAWHIWEAQNGLPEPAPLCVRPSSDATRQLDQKNTGLPSVFRLEVFFSRRRKNHGNSIPHQHFKIS